MIKNKCIVCNLNKSLIGLKHFLVKFKLNAKCHILFSEVIQAVQSGQTVSGQVDVRSTYSNVFKKQEKKDEEG